MSYNLTTAAKLSAGKIQKTPNLIIEIDGVEKKFSFNADYTLFRFDDGHFFDAGLFFDTKIPSQSTLPLISINGTTKNITQQLNQDKGGTGSVTSLTVAIVDKDGAALAQFSDKEMINRKAKAYLSFAGLEHPNDSIRIFSGVVRDFSVPPGEVLLTISAPDNFKRQDIFPLATTELVSNISNSAVLFEAVDVSRFKPMLGFGNNYIRINDEIMRVTIDYNTSFFIGVERGQLGTTASAHSAGDEIASIYNLTGKPIDMALRIMLSGGPTFYADLEIASHTTDRIFFNIFDIVDEYGVVEGDSVIVYDDFNNSYSGTITRVGQTGDLVTSFIDVDLFLYPGINYVSLVISSQYNVYTDGCRMLPSEVDIAQHLFIQNTFGAQFPEYNFFETDTIKAKQFIEEQLYFPVGAYFLPRKGRASLGYTAPSIAGDATPILDEDNIVNPDKITPKRSASRYFYNTVTYRTNWDPFDQKFLSTRFSVSADSVNRIGDKVENLEIEARGLPNEASVNNFIDLTSLRLLERYRFAATHLTVEVFYGVGYSIEVGDIVILNGKNLQIYDDTTGRRDTFERLMEVVNKRMDITTGKISLDLIDTSFGLEGRYAAISPASNISDYTTGRLKIERSFGTSLTDYEYEKWQRYFGHPVLVHNDDWSITEVTTLLGVDSADQNYLLISPTANTPAAGWTIRIAPYDNASAFQKRLNAFFCPQVEVVSGADNFNFDVSSLDAAKFFVGSIIRIHNDDFSIYSEELTVSAITGDTITVTEDIGFTPTVGQLIDGIGFVSDNGKRYFYF